MVANELKDDTRSSVKDEHDLLDLALKCFERVAVIGVVVSLLFIATELPAYF